MRTQRATGVPWYTLHKIFAGLRDAHLYCDNPAARTVLVKLSDWAIATTENMTDAQFEGMLGTEHGGMNEVLADVYVITGDAKYLRLAERFSHKRLLEPLSESRDTLDGLHSNTQIPKVVGFQRIYDPDGRAQLFGGGAVLLEDRGDHPVICHRGKWRQRALLSRR